MTSVARNVVCAAPKTTAVTTGNPDPARSVQAVRMASCRITAVSAVNFHEPGGVGVKARFEARTKKMVVLGRAELTCKFLGLKNSA